MKLRMNKAWPDTFGKLYIHEFQIKLRKSNRSSQIQVKDIVP